MVNTRGTDNHDNRDERDAHIYTNYHTAHCPSVTLRLTHLVLFVVALHNLLYPLDIHGYSRWKTTRCTRTRTRTHEQPHIRPHTYGHKKVDTDRQELTVTQSHDHKYGLTSLRPNFVQYPVSAWPTPDRVLRLDSVGLPTSCNSEGNKGHGEIGSMIDMALIMSDRVMWFDAIRLPTCYVITHKEHRMRIMTVWIIMETIITIMAIITIIW